MGNKKQNNWAISRNDIQYIVNNIIGKDRSPEELATLAKTLTDDDIIREYYKIPLDVRKKNFVDDIVTSLKEASSAFAKGSNVDIGTALKIADATTTEARRELENFIENLTNDEFTNFLFTITKHAEVNDRKRGIKNMHNSASGLSVLEAFINYASSYPTPVQYEKRLNNLMNDAENKNEYKEIIKYIKNSVTTDIIEIDINRARKLTKIWETDNTPFMPSDIFFADTISIMDTDIIIDQSIAKKANDDADKPDKIIYRVVIFDNFKKIIKCNEGDESEVSFVGAIIFKERYGHVIVPFGVSLNEDVIAVPFGCILDKSSSSFRDKFFMSVDKDSFIHRFQVAYRTWYSIQISMLHPIIKNVYRSNKFVPDNVQKNSSKKKNKVTKVKANNIRLHVINDDNDFELHSKRGQITRHCSAWYVVGHYRNYKSGKRIFIKPHWKGPLKDFNSIKVREREIILEDDNNENNS